MFPRLFEIGGFALPTYGFLLACAYLAAIWWAARKAPARGASPDDVADLGISILLASLVGSKLTLFLLSPGDYASREGLWRLLRSGGVFYGGLVAATAFGLWLVHRRKMKLWSIADLMAPSVALGEGIGRIGCLAAGCCWGKRADDLPWSIVFTDPYTADTIGTPLGAPLHPTQIYLSLAGFGMFALLEVVDRRRRFDGQVFWIFVVVHAVTRSVIELWRGDEVRGFLIPGVVSTSQAIAAASALVGLAMLKYLSGKPRDAATPAG